MLVLTLHRYNEIVIHDEDSGEDIRIILASESDFPRALLAFEAPKRFRIGRKTRVR